MKSIFFMDIDTQRDFMRPSGALYVPGAEKMVPKLVKLFDFARKNGITVLSSVDAHTPADAEFEQFPPHCIQKTEGQKKLDETLLTHPLTLENKPVDRNFQDIVNKYQQIIIEKQALDVFTNPVSERLVRVLPLRAIVFGVTTEHCVRKAALGLRSRGVKTAIIADAVRSLGPETEKRALEEMRVAGVEFIALEMLLGMGS